MKSPSILSTGAGLATKPSYPPGFILVRNVVDRFAQTKPSEAVQLLLDLLMLCVWVWVTSVSSQCLYPNTYTTHWLGHGFIFPYILKSRRKQKVFYIVCCHKLHRMKHICYKHHLYWPLRYGAGFPIKKRNPKSALIFKPLKTCRGNDFFISSKNRVNFWILKTSFYSVPKG